MPSEEEEYKIFDEPERPKTGCPKIDFIRYLVRCGRFRPSSKVGEMIVNGEYSEYDLECCVCTGTVTKEEKDELGQGAKYTICGSDSHGYRFYCVGKILVAEDGEFYFFITAHEDRSDYDLQMPRMRRRQGCRTND